MTVDERSDSVVALMVRQVLIISICGEDIVSSLDTPREEETAVQQMEGGDPPNDEGSLK